MKFRSAFVTLALGAMASLAAWSAEPVATKPVADADAKTTPTAKVRTAADKCDSVTGTRIRPALDRPCMRSTLPTRSYSKSDIDMTGEIDLNEALRKLDPIFH